MAETEEPLPFSLARHRDRGYVKYTMSVSGTYTVSGQRATVCREVGGDLCPVDPIRCLSGQVPATIVSSFTHSYMPVIRPPAIYSPELRSGASGLLAYQHIQMRIFFLAIFQLLMRQMVNSRSD